MTPSFFITVALGVTFMAATIDARTGRIPNALTIPAAVAGVLLHVPLGAAAVAVSIGGGALVALLPWLMHRTTQGAAIGGGDVKLFAALGTLCGSAMALEIEASAFVTLAVFAIVRLAFAGRLFTMLANVLRLLVRPFLPTRWRRPIAPEAFTAMRMGPAIFIAVVSVLVRDRLLDRVPWLAG